MSVNEILRQELNADETILWQGQPKQGILFRKQDVFLIPFSLLWCGFAVFWEMSAIQSDASWFFSLWGVPFVLLGLYFVFGRFVYDAAVRQKTHYVLTQQRVIMVEKNKIQSVDFHHLTAIILQRHHGGYGSIILGWDMSHQFGNLLWAIQPNNMPKLAYVANVDVPYALIKQQRNRSQPL